MFHLYKNAVSSDKEIHLKHVTISLSYLFCILYVGILYCIYIKLFVVVLVLVVGMLPILIIYLLFMMIQLLHILCTLYIAHTVTLYEMFY